MIDDPTTATAAPAPSPTPSSTTPTPAASLDAEIAALRASPEYQHGDPAARQRMEDLYRNKYPVIERATLEEERAGVTHWAETVESVRDEILETVPAPPDGWNLDAVDDLVERASPYVRDGDALRGGVRAALSIIQRASQFDPCMPERCDAELAQQHGDQADAVIADARAGLKLLYPNAEDYRRVLHDLDDPAQGRLGDSPELVSLLANFYRSARR